MQGKMKVAVMTGVGRSAFEEREIPRPKAGEVLVKLEYIGICGSDLHYYATGGIGDCRVEPPFVLGHEAGGTVVEAGAGVTDLKAGDRVALEPGKTCGHCEFCRTGRYNLCPDVVFFATPPVDGVFQEYVAHEAGLCFKLPDNVSTMEGALIEPLAVGFHAANLGEAHIGQTAVVTGSRMHRAGLPAGDEGHGGVEGLRGGRDRGTAEEGAGMRRGRGDQREDGGRGAGGHETDRRPGTDLVIETAGTEATTRQAIQMAKKGSTIVLVGLGASGEMTLPMTAAINKELTFKSICRYRHCYPMAIDAVATGRINIRGIVTNEFAFDDLPEALDICINNKDEVVKGVVRVAD